MTGICGLHRQDGGPVDVEILGAMSAAAVGACRGPRGVGIWRNGEVGLVQSSAPPGEAASRWRRDGGPVVVADARLDNRLELMGELDLAADARTPLTDAELIRAAYERWGEECPGHLLGDFAFAVWDSRRRILFCARDPLGVKPLHWGRVGAQLCVASSATQLARHPGIGARWNEIAVARLLVGTFDLEGASFFDGVRVVPPGGWLRAGPDAVRRGRFWSPHDAPEVRYRRPQEYAERLRELLARAVRCRLGAGERPVGIFLSGGLDSSSLAAIASRIAGDCGPELIGLSVVFDRLTACDERARIESTGRRLGLTLESAVADAEPLLVDGGRSLTEPEFPLPIWPATGRLMGRLRHRGGRRLLTGMRGDEVSAGSPAVYADYLRRGSWLRLAGELGRHRRRTGASVAGLLRAHVAANLLGPAAWRLLPGRWRPPAPVVPDWLHPELVERTGLRSHVAGLADRRQLGLSARQRLRHRFGTELLVRPVQWIDRQAARHGLEAVHPFLDRRLVEFILGVPPELLYSGGDAKPLLREAMRGRLPEGVRRRASKTSFVPFAVHVARSERSAVRELLQSSRLAAHGLIVREKLEAAFADLVRGDGADLSRYIWSIIGLEIWFREHWSDRATARSSEQEGSEPVARARRPARPDSAACA